MKYWSLSVKHFVVSNKQQTVEALLSIQTDIKYTLEAILKYFSAVIQYINQNISYFIQHANYRKYWKWDMV